MYVLYEVFLYLVLVLTLPYFLFTGVLRGKYLANVSERMGFFRGRAAEHDLWVHAVSVGEALAARPVVAEILKQRPWAVCLLQGTVDIFRAGPDSL